MLALQIQPELRAIAKIAAEPHRSIRGDRPPPIQNIRYAPRRHTEIERKPVGAQASDGKFPLQQTAWVDDRSHGSAFMIIDLYEEPGVKDANGEPVVTRVLTIMLADEY